MGVWCTYISPLLPCYLCTMHTILQQLQHKGLLQSGFYPVGGMGGGGKLPPQTFQLPPNVFVNIFFSEFLMH